MTKLSELVSSNNFKLSALNQTLSERRNGIPGRTIDISFWGTRWVKINDDPEFVDLDVVANKMLQTVKNLQGEAEAVSTSQSFNVRHYEQIVKEAEEGLSSLEKVRELYKASEGHIFTRILRAILRSLDYLLDPFGTSTGYRSIAEISDGQTGLGNNIEWVLKSFPARANPRSPVGRIQELRKLNELVQENSDAEIRAEFARLHPFYQKEIKERMWLSAGGALNPHFASGQIDWSGLQIAINPIQRQHLFDTVNRLLSRATCESDLFSLLFDGQANRIPLTDQAIRQAFSNLRLAAQQAIKKGMWERAGGMDDPHFAAGQADWAGDQLRANPLSPYHRQLILTAIAEVNARRIAIAYSHPIGRDYPELIDVEDAISRPG